MKGRLQKEVQFTREKVVKETGMIYVYCSIELASEALEAGDEPFGSVLVDSDG